MNSLPRLIFCAALSGLPLFAGEDQPDKPARPEPALPSIAWYSDVAQAFADARERHQPVLILMELPGQSFSRQLLDTFANPRIVDALKSFVPVRVDIRNDSQLTDRLSIRVAPDLRVFDPEGNQIARIDGNIALEALAKFLAAVKDGKAPAGAPTLSGLFPGDDLESFAKLEASGKLPEGKRLDRLIALAGGHDGESRAEARRLLGVWAPRLAAQLPAFLNAAALKPRVAAFDALSDIDAPLGDYDPWSAPIGKELAAKLLQWGTQVAGAAAKRPAAEVAALFPALSGRVRTQVNADVKELGSADAGRREAARQRLLSAGRGVVPVLRERARSVSAQDPELALRCDEVRFRLLLDPETLRKRPSAPHNLAVGNPGQRAEMLNAILSSGSEDLEALAREGACDRDALVREVAVRAAPGVLKSPNELLRDTLRDPDANVRVAALTVMAAKPATEGNAENDSAPTGIVDWWKRRKQPDAPPAPMTNSQAIATYLASEPDADMIGHAVRALAQVDSETSRAALRKLLKDKRWQVRAAAVEALGKMHDAESAPEMAELAVGDDGFVAGQAIEALTHDGEAGIDFETLKKAVEKHPEVTLSVLKTLGGSHFSKSKKADQLLRSYTRHASPEIRARALLSLASDESRTAFEEVSAGFADSSPLVRAAAVESLRTLARDFRKRGKATAKEKPPSGYLEVRERVAAMLHDKDTHLRDEAIETLMYFGDWNMCWTEYRANLSDPQESRRSDALHSLRYLPPEMVLQAVRACLADGGPKRASREFEAAAGMALSSLEPKGAGVEPDSPVFQAVFELLPHVEKADLGRLCQAIRSAVVQNSYNFEAPTERLNDKNLAKLLGTWLEKLPDGPHKHAIRLLQIQCARLDDDKLRELLKDPDLETRRMATAILIRRESKGPADLVKVLIADSSADFRAMGVVAAIPLEWRRPLADPSMKDIIAGHEIHFYPTQYGTMDLAKVPKVVELPVETLEKLLKDDDESVRVATAYLMSLEGGDQGIPVLSKNLKTSERPVDAAVLLLRAVILAWSDELTPHVAEAFAVIKRERETWEWKQLLPFLKELKGEQIKKLRGQLKLKDDDQ